MHVDINIYFFSKEKLGEFFSETEIQDISLEPFKKQEDIIISILSNTEKDIETNIHRITKAIFYELEMFVTSFYRAMAIRAQLLYSEMYCMDYFESLSKCLLSIHELPAMSIIKRHQSFKELGKLTTKINIQLSKAYEYNTILKDFQLSILRDSKYKPIRSLLIEYMQEHTSESERIDRQCITNAFTHADQVLSRRSIFNTQLISAIIGGIIGGITAVLIMYLSTIINNPFSQ